MPPSGGFFIHFSLLKTLRETLEALGGDRGEIAEVVAKDIDELAKEAIKKGSREPRLPEFPVRNADGSLTDHGKRYYEDHQVIEAVS